MGDEFDVQSHVLRVANPSRKASGKKGEQVLILRYREIECALRFNDQRILHHVRCYELKIRAVIDCSISFVWSAFDMSPLPTLNASRARHEEVLAPMGCNYTDTTEAQAFDGSRIQCVLEVLLRVRSLLDDWMGK